MTTGPGPAKVIKISPSQVFFCEFCKTFPEHLLYRTPMGSSRPEVFCKKVALRSLTKKALQLYQKRDSGTGVFL